MSLHKEKIVGSSSGGALVLLETSLFVTFTELSKTTVCGALSMGHGTYKNPCHSSKRVG